MLNDFISKILCFEDLAIFALMKCIVNQRIKRALKTDETE